MKARLRTDITLDALDGHPERLHKLLCAGLRTVMHLRKMLIDHGVSLLRMRPVRIGLRYNARAAILLDTWQAGSQKHTVRLVEVCAKSGKVVATADPMIASTLLIEKIRGDTETAVRVVAGIERARKRLLDQLEQSTRWI
jgi:hypothetical protein